MNGSKTICVRSANQRNVQYLAKVYGEIIGTASLNRKPRRMSHRGEFGISLKSVVIQMAQNDNHMTTPELVLNMLAEASTTEISRQKAPGIPRAWYAGSFFARNL